MYFSRLFSRTGLVALLLGLIAACGGGSEVPPVGNLPVLSEAPSQVANSNVLPVLVDSGPAGTGYNVNRLYTTVTICEPGSIVNCQIIDHVLVDTGSTGLRLLASELNGNLRLNRLTGAARFPLLNCVQFVDNTYAWGTVATADVLLGDKRAASVPLQIVADAAAGPAAPTCAAGGKAITTAADLGARGIIGMGLFKEDCGSRCASTTNNGTYYTCTDANCTSSTGTRISTDNQVKNPVPLFASDNNGFLIDLPRVASPGLPTLNGTLTFGIGTQSLASVTVLTPDTFGYFTTVLPGQNFTRSFIDSGSNGLFFESAIAKCGDGFYCPTSPTTLLAKLVDPKGASSPELLFPIGNATDLFASRINTVRNHVFPTLAGDLPGHLSTFDWGLPFFYGRRVFFGIEGHSIQGQPNVPFYAF